ncbi:hypothetical protein SEET0084_01395 [Salmonella enterica subsp. enterica serovar Typhimurium var. Copenhagen str. 0084]|nr:hypothetical protein SEET0084_01395 [Salmonella enterica subsp. enterica serovar Typhimurium var. Copenhagen str. 0084]
MLIFTNKLLLFYTHFHSNFFKMIFAANVYKVFWKVKAQYFSLKHLG